MLLHHQLLLHHQALLHIMRDTVVMLLLLLLLVVVLTHSNKNLVEPAVPAKCCHVAGHAHTPHFPELSHIHQDHSSSSTDIVSSSSSTA
jgi:hypothetical protein